MKNIIRDLEELQYFMLIHMVGNMEHIKLALFILALMMRKGIK